MLIVHVGRAQLLKALPPGGIVAEVGVFRGRFSASILSVTAPDTLHLIDPWLVESGSTRAEGAQMPAAYAEVQTAFAQQISAGTVVLHRESSREAAAKFADATFDWVYIDAMHDYANVLADLRAFGPRVKPDGFLLGHDFSAHEYARAQRFGVIPAVLEYAAEANLRLVAITNEDHPSYLLAHRDNDTTLPALRARLLALSPARPIEVHPALLVTYDQAASTLPGDRVTQLLRFGYRNALPG